VKKGQTEDKKGTKEGHERNTATLAFVTP